MLEGFLRDHVRAPLAHAAARLSALGASGTSLAAASLVVGLIAVPAIGYGHFWIGLGLILLSRAIALVAAETEASTLAAALDPIFFASLPFAFALADPSRALAATFLLFAFVADVAAAPRAWRGIEHAVAALAFMGACLFPAWFSLIAYGLGLACFALAGFRIGSGA